MFGKGLLIGMSITLRHFFGRNNTVEYPDEKIPMSQRFRGGALILDMDKCIACGLCATACPNSVIKLASDKNANNKKVLTEHSYCAELCLFCNLCLEACPVGALTWSKEYENACYHREKMNHDCIAEASFRKQEGVI